MRHRCYTCGMPTTRPRHTLTETDELHEILERGRRLWPHDAENPRALLLHLVREGIAHAEAREPSPEDRLAAIDALEQSKPTWYPDGYLDDVRGGWPE